MEDVLERTGCNAGVVPLSVLLMNMREEMERKREATARMYFQYSVFSPSLFNPSKGEAGLKLNMSASLPVGNYHL